MAIVAMAIYHFCFDLAFMGWLVADFANDWRWLGFRISILGTFLFIAGVSLGLASTHGDDARRFWRRIAIIAAAALLVSAGSYLMFPGSFIYFGVLHAIALMCVLARWLLPLRTWLIPLGVAIIGAGASITSALFDPVPLNWIGMMTFKPRTEDYVPLFPWFGVLLIGAGTGVWLGKSEYLAAAHMGNPRFPQSSRASCGLRWMGRHSLAIYLIHQPLILGAMMLARQLH